MRATRSKSKPQTRVFARTRAGTDVRGVRDATTTVRADHARRRCAEGAVRGDVAKSGHALECIRVHAGG
jgi:hypothetical protein